MNEPNQQVLRQLSTLIKLSIIYYYYCVCGGMHIRVHVQLAEDNCVESWFLLPPFRWVLGTEFRLLGVLQVSLFD